MEETIEIPSYEELLNSLDEEFRTEQVKKELKIAYEAEVTRLFECAGRLKIEGKPYSVKMFKFFGAGRQLIADFWVKDLSKPIKDEHNFHLQNISQWNYAGCICFSVSGFKEGAEYIISRHH